MWDPLHLQGAVEAAKGDVALVAHALPPLPGEAKAALRNLETPVISAEGAVLKAFVTGVLARVPVIGGALGTLVGPLIDQGLELERQAFEKALG